MPHINVLDSDTINKIAAGEVVERPSSVVKELVENAIDAHATAITVEIRDGGTSLIRVTDNGGGIEKDDIPLAFLRHSTSKIRSVEDLMVVSSLGFRGEALSSIASVAQVELITKTPRALTGARYCIEGGEETVMEEIGCPSGTTMLVRNLFYNTPARRKFLKSDMTEASYVNDLLMRLSLSHPEVSFKFINNHQNKIHTAGNMQLKDIIYNIYGRDITANLLEIGQNSANMRIHGFIGKPLISRGNRAYENYFINGRYIKSPIITKAIEEAYKTFVMVHKYPFTAFHLEIDASYIDVNVHPTKMEIRFTNNDEVYQLVYRTIRDALSGRDLIPDVTLDTEREVAQREKEAAAARLEAPAPEPFEAARLAALGAPGAPGASGASRPNPHTQPQPHNTFGSNRPYEAKPFSERTQSFASKPPFQTPSALHEPSASYPRTEQADDSEIPRTVQAGNESNQAGLAGNKASQMNPVVDDAPNTEPLKHPESAADQVPASAPATAANPVLAVAPAPAEPATEDTPSMRITSQEQMELFDDRLLTKKARLRHRLIGQIFDTYWLVEYDGKLFIIDQHAAHEKVMYEKLKKHYESSTPVSQYMEPPLILSLSMHEESTLKEYMPQLQKIGFEIEHFGGSEYAIRAVPSELYGYTERDLFIDLLDSMTAEAGRLGADIITDRIATMACKAAVKGNQALSFTEADALIDQLLEAENPYNCPHGRPTIISMTKYELEKKFKRIQ